jgi:hypothetical protein
MRSLQKVPWRQLVRPIKVATVRGWCFALPSASSYILYLKNPGRLGAEGQTGQERQTDELVGLPAWYDLAAGMDVVTGGRLELVV